MKNRRHSPSLSTYDLIDWNCPEYQEEKPGSTEYSGMHLSIRGLLDGRYIWQTTNTRQRFADGSVADWRIGNPAMTSRMPCNTFVEALALARKELESTPFVQWKDYAS